VESSSIACRRGDGTQAREKGKKDRERKREIERESGLERKGKELGRGALGASEQWPDGMGAVAATVAGNLESKE